MGASDATMSRSWAVLGACVLLSVLFTAMGQDDNVPEKPGPLVVASAPETLALQIGEKAQAVAELQAQAQAQAQARAKAQYDSAMSKMRALRDKLGNMAEDYEQRSQYASDEEAKAAKRERAQVAQAAASFPFLGLQTSEKKQHDSLVQDLDDDKDVLAEAMKHKEVPKLIKSLDDEHKALRKEMETDPMATLKHMQARKKERKRAEVKRTMEWRALEDGWDGEPDGPSEADVKYQALGIEANLEKDGTKLSDTQKTQIEEAVRVHEMNSRKIDMAKQRLDKMQELEEKDEMDSKKELAKAQGEALYDEQDAMYSEVAAAKAEAQQALETQKQANAPDPAADLVQALNDANAVVPESK